LLGHWTIESWIREEHSTIPHQVEGENRSSIGKIEGVLVISLSNQNIWIDCSLIVVLMLEKSTVLLNLEDFPKRLVSESNWSKGITLLESGEVRDIICIWVG